jgi:aryl-alcohol dehydrogenase-like predicted oxidoreductase
MGVFNTIAEERGVSPYAITIAWHLAQFPTSIPIPGASTSASILDSLVGTTIELTTDEISELNQSCPLDGPLEGELLDLPKFRA